MNSISSDSSAFQHHECVVIFFFFHNYKWGVHYTQDLPKFIHKKTSNKPKNPCNLEFIACEEILYMGT